MKIHISPRQDAAVRRSIMALGMAGTVIFGLLFVAAFLYPTVFESWARRAIAQEVQVRVQTKLDSLNDASIGRLAGRVINQNNEEKVKESVQLASVIDKVSLAMLDPKCLCRLPADKRVELVNKVIEGSVLVSSIDRLEAINATLKQLIQSKYQDVAASLIREVRIFTAANAAVFFFLTSIAWMWKGAAIGLLAPGFVLAGAAALTAATYLFHQDWLKTILLNDYVGLWYIPYLGSALAFMLDMVFNRARITSILVGGGVLVVTAPLVAACS